VKINNFLIVYLNFNCLKNNPQLAIKNQVKKSLPPLGFKALLIPPAIELNINVILADPIFGSFTVNFTLNI
jgi:hypothetical protein